MSATTSNVENVDVQKKQKQLVVASNAAAADSGHSKALVSGCKQGSPVVRGQMQLSFMAGTAPAVDKAVAKFF